MPWQHCRHRRGEKRTHCSQNFGHPQLHRVEGDVPARGRSPSRSRSKSRGRSPSRGPINQCGRSPTKRTNQQQDRKRSPVKEKTAAINVCNVGIRTPKINIQIGHKKPIWIEAMPDTGASATIINSRLLKHFDCIKMNPNNRPALVSATGAGMHCKGTGKFKINNLTNQK